jgi:RNA polymerase sigma factor (sigma-70 family)
MSVDTSSLEVQLASLRPRLERVFHARRAGHVAEDLASETLLRVLTALRGGVQVLNLGAYTAGTARRVLLEYFRSRDENAESLEPFVERLAGPGDGDAAANDSTDERKRRVARLRACLGRLAPEDQALLSRYYAEGKNPANRAALATDLGVTPNTLRIRACRARRTLTQCVSGQAEHPSASRDKRSAEMFSARPGPPRQETP